MSTAPARPGTENEDFAAVAPAAAVLLDGAGIPAGLESGCHHGVAWFARTLGTVLLARLCDHRAGTLAGCLHDALSEVRSRHAGACDLAHPGSPSATVIAVRFRGDLLDYLVLTDSSLVLSDHEGGSQVISDHRHDETCTDLRAQLDLVGVGDPGRAAAFRTYVAAVRDLKNVPGGFWVASAEPDVASEALTGSRPLSGLESALLLSDGASRLADLFSLASFGDVAALVRRAGPAELIRQVRAAEDADPLCLRWPRSKVYDDATAVCCELSDGPA